MRKSLLATVLAAVTAVVVAGVLPSAVRADDVYLTNGRKFEGVIAETTETQVRIRMPGGVLSLPKSQVLRVVSGESALAGYLERKEALRRGAGTRAQDWLDLALWARSQGLDQGAREAALVAAELEPALKGLEPVLRGFHYTFDEQLGRWISYEDSLRRRGFVFVSGVWMSREEVAEQARQREEELERRRAAVEAARAEQTARQTEMLLATQTALLGETLRERDSTPAVAYPPYGWPVVVIPGFFPPRCPHGSCDHPPPGDGDQPPVPSRPASHHGGFNRIPGSLIPGELSPHR